MPYIKLNIHSFSDNIAYFSKLCSLDKLSIALKDNAYGHGINEIASMCKELSIKHVFVSDNQEAKIVKKYNFDTVLVLHDIPSFADESYYAINCIESIAKFPPKTNVELKIDTGMHRNGILPNELEKALELINKHELKLKGIFTHFCCADEDNDMTSAQEELFLQIVDKAKRLIDHDIRVHCANSSGVHKVDMDRYDLARIGIGAYGYIDLEEYRQFLKPVLSVYAQKLSTRVLNKGDSIGYGSKAYIVQEDDFMVTNYDLGYGKGFLRLGELKKSTIQDGREILGRVSMDSFSVCGEDEEVCVFSDATRFALTHDTIVYEVLTSLSPFIKRILI